MTSNTIQVFKLTFIIIFLTTTVIDAHGCITQQKIIKIEEPSQSIKRVLQQEKIYGFRIGAEFPQNIPDQINLLVLKKIFFIASKYFQTVIKVTDNVLRVTKYPLKLGTVCGKTIVGQKYKNNGFDINLMQSLIFIGLQSKADDSSVATLSTCVVSRWPIYGYLEYNSLLINTDLSKTGIFHKNVYVTMHQMTHFLGLNADYFKGMFYTSYRSNLKLNLDEIIKEIIIDNTLRKIIITKNVVKYVKQYFGCNDNLIGALLEQDGGQGTAGVHWERKVYLDQIMTASVWPSGLRITELTLQFLKDTGFYYSIDHTLSDTASFGKNKGCSFARGQATSSPQYCTQSDKIGCDYYGIFGGSCDNSKLGSGTKLVTAFSNLVCTLPEATSLNSPAREFGAMSRCFEKFQKGTPQCHRADCISQGIRISAGGASVICAKGQAKVTINSVEISCPINYEAFCSRQNCQDWCSTNGICIRGKCVGFIPTIMLNCQLFDPFCETCSETQCQRCRQGFTLNINKCQNCFPSINNCQFCQDNKCITCLQGFFPSFDRQWCQECSVVIQNCVNCLIDEDDQMTKCMECTEGLIVSSDQLFCELECKSPCQSCVNGSSTKCISCKLGTYLYGTKCISCKSSLGYYKKGKKCFKCKTGCATCLSLKICKGCAIGYYLNASLLCIKCAYPCNTCSGPSTKCLSCLNGKKQKNGIC